MIKKFDHFGLVVKNTEEAVALLSDLFGFEIVESLVLREEGFKSTMIFKEDVGIELLEPIGPEGIIQRFVEKHGWGGLHHVSIQVDSLEDSIKVLKAKGVQLIDEKPRRVTETASVVFVHPHSTKGLLIELCHRTEPSR